MFAALLVFLVSEGTTDEALPLRSGLSDADAQDSRRVGRNSSCHQQRDSQACPHKLHIPASLPRKSSQSL